jgi:hypothetical protein
MFCDVRTDPTLCKISKLIDYVSDSIPFVNLNLQKLKSADADENTMSVETINLSVKRRKKPISSMALNKLELKIFSYIWIIY